MLMGSSKEPLYQLRPEHARKSLHALVNPMVVEKRLGPLLGVEAVSLIRQPRRDVSHRTSPTMTE